jgi:hypothetical protein
VLFTAYQLFCPTLLGPTLVQSALSHFLNTPAYDLSKLWNDPPIAQDEVCVEGDLE